MNASEPQNLQIEGYTIHYNKFIGKGQYGLVWEATHPQINTPLCAKQMVISQQIDNSKQLQREIDIMMNISEADNKNLIKLYRAFKSTTVFYIIMERIIGDDLEKKMRHYQINNQRFPLQNIFNIVKQIANGFKTLNSKSIIHRDLKPANILISQDGTVKICDFGMGRVVDQVNAKLFLTKVGTPAYVAPQLYFETKFSTKCDVYSLGIIVYQMLYNSFPFTASTESELIEFLKEQRQGPINCPQIQQPGTQEQKSFFTQFLQKTITFLEEDRYSWDQVFQQIDQSAQLFEQQQLQQTPTKVEKHKPKIIIIQNPQEEQEGERKLYDSIFVLQQNYQPVKFNNDKYNYSSQYVDTSKAGRINHILKIMIAKYDLGDKFLLKFIQNVENLKRDETFKEFHYNLILTCIVGYQQKLMYNAKAFSTNSYNYLSQSIRDKYKKVDLEIAIQEYSTDQTQNSQEVKKEVSKRFQSISYSYNYQENFMLQILSKRLFQMKDVTDFKNFLQQQDNHDFEKFAYFYNIFYESYLQNLLKLDKNTSQDQLIFIAYCEAFNNLEKDYPFDKYSEQNPKYILLNENIPDILKNYINAKRQTGKK